MHADIDTSGASSLAEEYASARQRRSDNDTATSTSDNATTTTTTATTDPAALLPGEDEGHKGFLADEGFMGILPPRDPKHAQPEYLIWRSLDATNAPTSCVKSAHAGDCSADDMAGEKWEDCVSMDVGKIQDGKCEFENKRKECAKRKFKTIKDCVTGADGKIAPVFLTGADGWLGKGSDTLKMDGMENVTVTLKDATEPNKGNAGPGKEWDGNYSRNPPRLSLSGS